MAVQNAVIGYVLLNTAFALKKLLEFISDSLAFDNTPKYSPRLTTQVWVPWLCIANDS